MTAHMLESLPTTKVSLLIQTLNLHEDHLRASHLDAKRCNENGAKPCYLVDYQMLHAYMYEMESRPELVVQLEYLLRQRDILFIIGYGTAIEVFHRLRVLTGVDFTSIPWDDLKRGDDELTYDSLVSKYLPPLRESLKQAPGYASSSHTTALARLQHILLQPNFIYISEVETALEAPTTDAQAYDVSLAALHTSRPSDRFFYPNLADALNFAGVVGLRKAAADPSNNFVYHAFLLTTARSLLDEESWVRDPVVERWGQKASLSRSPSSAIYSHIVQTMEPDPAAGAAYTARLLSKVAAVEGQLLDSPGYSSPLPDFSDSEWEHIVASRQFSEGFAQQLATLSDLVQDPVISEFQRIYDNTQAAIANWGPVSQTHSDSPRRVFDIVLSISEVLRDDPNGTSGLADLWRRAIRVEDVALADDLVVRSYCGGPQGMSRPYLVAEFHGQGYTVLRWPSNRTPHRIVSAFMWVLGSREISKGAVCVGTSDGPWVYDAEFPLTFRDIATEVYRTVPSDGGDAVQRGAPTPDSGEPNDSRLHWIRLVADGIELFADILTPADSDPLVGIIARRPRLSDVVSLYTATSGRFLFQSWLAAMLEDAGIGDTTMEA